MRLKFTNPWWVVIGAVTGLFVCNGPSSFHVRRIPQTDHGGYGLAAEHCPFAALG